MKRKELKKMIKTEIRSLTPHILPKIDLKAIPLYDAQIDEKPRKSPNFHAVGRLSLLLVVVILSLTVYFFQPKFVDETPPVIDKQPLTVKEEVYTFSALSAISLFNANPSNNLLINNQDGFLIEDQIAVLSKYLYLIEFSVGDRNLIEIKTLPSDNPLYQTKLVYHSLDLLNKPIEYVFYYNEESENQEETRLNGIMIADYQEYILEGKFEREDDETKLKLKAYITSGDYVIVEEKREADEQKFFYQVVRNNQVVSENKIKIETEDGRFKIDLTFADKDKEIEYKFKKQKDNKILIEYEIETVAGEDEEGEIIVYVVYDMDKKIHQYKYIIKVEDDEKIIKDRRLKSINPKTSSTNI
ncbi:MAG: hypothetical protein M0R05_06955 [Bacilli bacterium]|nr:hypothetical protein [Bacilli bacterium]MDD4166592.1 hypothetical protein [Endomicrobiaceae bacterium]